MITEKGQAYFLDSRDRRFVVLGTNIADVTSCENALYIYLSISLSQGKRFEKLVNMTIRVPTEIVVFVVVFRSFIPVQRNKNHGGRESRF